MTPEQRDEFIRTMFGTVCVVCDGQGYIDLPMRIYPRVGIEYERRACAACGGTGRGETS